MIVLDPKQSFIVAGQTCSYPGSPAHASVTFTNERMIAGTIATYTCDNGYELLGPSRRLCHQNGTWTPLGIPFCVK
ncbi:hypothetical protein BLA29_011645 [Euroglyphus maynei]|uniref:Sushi domain-containing protein n=1 Tax=Euroglyphus maynei TaxID=6958 RepID=A0A1Y3AQH9_EURMA|nr:hypothetical protein BLA29_011645 [Euroglyphus maynei]